MSANEFNLKMGSARRFAGGGNLIGATLVLDMLGRMDVMRYLPNRVIFIGFRGVLYSLRGMHNDAVECFRSALYSEGRKAAPSVELARLCLDFAICLFNCPGDADQRSVNYNEAHSMILRAMEIYQHLGHASSADFAIANGFRGYSLSRRNPVEATSIMQAAQSVMCHLKNNDEPDLINIARQSKRLDWLYDCRALITERQKNERTRYTVVLSGGAARRFVVATIY